MGIKDRTRGAKDGTADTKKGSADTKDNVHGEGNYEASRQYKNATKAFVESGKVEEAARAAAPVDAREAADMKAAEEAGLVRAKGEHIALKHNAAPGAEDGTKVSGKPKPE